MGRCDVEDKLASRYVLFSCEGTVEEVVIGKLYEGDRLLMPKDRVVVDPIFFTPYTRLRKADQIAQRFFGTSYVAGGACGLFAGAYS